MKYGHPTLLRQPLWVELPSDKDVKFLIRPMSYGEVYGLNEYYYIKDKLSYVAEYKSFDLLESHILDTKGCIGFDSIPEVIRHLSLDDKNFLEHQLFVLSSLTMEQLTNIEKLLYIISEPSLQSDTFNCEKCKLIPGMQQARNCPLLSDEDRLPDVHFKLKLGNYIYNHCPIVDLDTFVVNQIHTAYSAYSSGVFPISGGIDTQSVWFVLVVQKYKYIKQLIQNSNV